MKLGCDALGNFRYKKAGQVHCIRWLVIRDCSCRGTGQIESDWDAGVYYPCVTCNPGRCRLAFDPTREPRPPKLDTRSIF